MVSGDPRSAAHFMYTDLITLQVHEGHPINKSQNITFFIFRHNKSKRCKFHNDDVTDMTSARNITYGSVAIKQVL